MLSIKDKVLLACKANNITLTEFATQLGITQPSLSNRLKTGKFTQDELVKMATMLNCKIDCSWILPNGTRLQ